MLDNWIIIPPIKGNEKKIKVPPMSPSTKQKTETVVGAIFG